MEYKEENKKLVELSGRYKYYDFNEETIKQIVEKDINEVTSTEWRTLIQMIYPTRMIGSGLFQGILIFKITNTGVRIDPPLEAYSRVDEVTNGDCLLFKIVRHIKENSKIKLHNSWNKTIKKTEKESGVLIGLKDNK